jgi:hypothetical protein
MMRKGPNDARCVIGVIGEFYIFISFFLMFYSLLYKICDRQEMTRTNPNIIGPYVSFFCIFVTLTNVL